MTDKDLFAIVLSWQTGLLCLGIYMLTYVFRTIIEAAWKNATKNKLWNDLALPLAPLLAGLLLALFARKFPWPPQLTNAYSAKILYAMACGGLSGFFYARLRALLKPAEKPDEKQPTLLETIASAVVPKKADAPSEVPSPTQEAAPPVVPPPTKEA